MLDWCSSVGQREGKEMGAAVDKKAGTLRAMVLGIVCALALALGIAPMAAFADGDSESDADVVYGLKVYDANPSVSDDSTFVTSDNFLNQTFRQTLEENGIPTRVWNLETQTGDTRTLADGSTTYLYSIEFRTTKGKDVNLDSTPADILDEFYWIEGDPEGQLYLEVDLTWNPQSYNGKWEPFTPEGSATTLLPYVINNNVLTFSDYPGLGEWYQLDAKLYENVEFNGVIWGGGDDRTMTILRGYLNEDDSFHNDDTGGQTFPLWLRGDHGTDNYTFL